MPSRLWIDKSPFVAPFVAAISHRHTCAAEMCTHAHHPTGVFDAVAGNSAGKLDGSSSDAAAVSGGASGGGAILATPGVVHFGGFTPGAVHCQVVRLVNASAVAALRAHMIPPESPYFKVKGWPGPAAALCCSACVSTATQAARRHRHARRPTASWLGAQVTHKRCSGAILPGLSEQLVVEFCPDQLRYYYDMIRVHSSVSGAGGAWIAPLPWQQELGVRTHAAAVRCVPFSHSKADGRCKATSARHGALNVVKQTPPCRAATCSYRCTATRSPMPRRSHAASTLAEPLWASAPCAVWCCAAACPWSLSSRCGS